MEIKNFPKIKYKANALGQTMIETLVAVFILVMGISAAMGLATYTLASSGGVTRQIIATGLAREGIEAVKAMRDTNWLKLAINLDCYNFSTTNLDAKCYKDWLAPSGSNGNGNDKGFNLKQGGGFNTATYKLRIDSDSDNKQWVFDTDNKYGLDLNASLTGDTGFYNGNGSTHGTSEYYRKITVSFDDTTVPYNQATLGPLMKVKSQVWWTDKRCPRAADWPGLGKCSVEMELYLTNWKNF